MGFGDWFGDQPQERKGINKWIDQIDQSRAAAEEDPLSWMDPTMKGVWGQRPDTEMAIDPETGELLPQYQMQWQGIQNAPRKYTYQDMVGGLEGISPYETGQYFEEAGAGYGTLAERAYGTETDPWTQKLLESQQLGQATQGDVLSQQMASERTRMMEDLAARGGLEGGARERLVRSTGRDTMAERQRLAREGMQQRLGIESEAERQRLGLQERLPGMAMGLEQHERDVATSKQKLEMDKIDRLTQQSNTIHEATMKREIANKMGQLGVDQANIAQALTELRGKNASELQKWMELAGLAGASETAKAQTAASEGGGGGLLGSVFETIGIKY
ncbi:MAG: hypothetical protein GY861_09600 [bacterium]|nr:hypothetical protein [bacterium]